jgi:hypothetical protein
MIAREVFYFMPTERDLEGDLPDKGGLNRGQVASELRKLLFNLIQSRPHLFQTQHLINSIELTYKKFYESDRSDNADVAKKFEQKFLDHIDYYQRASVGAPALKRQIKHFNFEYDRLIKEISDLERDANCAEAPLSSFYLDSVNKARDMQQDIHRQALTLR